MGIWLNMVILGFVTITINNHKVVTITINNHKVVTITCYNHITIS
jgi:hypothetical protein